MSFTWRLAGCNVSWRFRDSAWLERWMASRPWDALGGRPHVIRLSGRGYEQAVVDHLARMFVGHTLGEADPRFIDVCLAEGQALEATVLDVVGVGQATRYERLAMLARQLASRPWLIVVRGPLTDRSIVEEGSALLDALSKLDRPRAACLVIDTVSEPTIGEFHCFAAGWLADGVMSALDRGGEAMWGPYVATRLAWECGGDLARAQEFESSWSRALPFGDDTELEVRLNACANSAFDALPEGARGELAAWVRALVDDVEKRRGPPSPPDVLLRERLAWYAPGDRRWRPVPWVARAMLLRRECENTRHLLRGCLVTAPLANEMLRRCFDLEAWIVAVVSSRARTEPSQEAIDRHARFVLGRASECAYYPKDSPATPQDAWGHVTYGEAINGTLGKRDSPHEQLRLLRNALSHGHYVSWSTVNELLEVESGLRSAW